MVWEWYVISVIGYFFLREQLSEWWKTRMELVRGLFIAAIFLPPALPYFIGWEYPGYFEKNRYKNASVNIYFYPNVNTPRAIEAIASVSKNEEYRISQIKFINAYGQESQSLRIASCYADIHDFKNQKLIDCERSDGVSYGVKLRK
jgi:hypothetical protein